MPGDGTAAKSSLDAKRQSIENAWLSECEPILARFGRKETKALQRPKIAASPVSEVRMVTPNSFETTEKSGAVFGPAGVRNRELAEGKALASNPLGGLPRTPLTIERTPEQTRFARGFAESGPGYLHFPAERDAEFFR
jgi:hypothetical protein